MDGPEHLFKSADGIIEIGRFGPVFAGLFGKGLTAQSLGEVLDWQHTVMPGQPIMSFSLAFAAERLTDDTKAAADRLLAEFRDDTCASATVMAVEGFEGSAARAMLATIHLLTRAKYPRKVFCVVDDAQQWLLDQDGDVDAIRAAGTWLCRFESDYHERMARARS